MISHKLFPNLLIDKDTIFIFITQFIMTKLREIEIKSKFRKNRCSLTTSYQSINANLAQDLRNLSRFMPLEETRLGDGLR